MAEANCNNRQELAYGQQPHPQRALHTVGSNSTLWPTYHRTSMESSSVSNSTGLLSNRTSTSTLTPRHHISMDTVERGSAIREARTQPSEATLVCRSTVTDLPPNYRSETTLLPSPVSPPPPVHLALLPQPVAPPRTASIASSQLARTILQRLTRIGSRESHLPEIESAPEKRREYRGLKMKKSLQKLGIRDETKSQLRHFLRIFSYSSWTDKLMLFAASIASICSGVTMPLMNVVFGRVFGSFTGYDKQGNVVIMTEAMFMNEIIICVQYLVYIFAARFALSYIAFFGFRVSSLRISAAIRLAYMRRLLAQPISTLDSMMPGQTAAVITVTANTLQLGISERLSSFLQSVALVVAALVVSFMYSWKLTLVTSCGMVFIVAVYAVTTPLLVRIMNQVQAVEIRAAMISSEILGAVRMVNACGAEAKMAQRYDACADESRQCGLRMSPVVAFQQTPVFFAIYATFALAFWFSLNEYIKGSVDSPQALIVVLFSVMMMTTSIGGITMPLSGAARAASASTMFYSIIDAPIPQSSGHSQGPATDAAKTGDIMLHNVHFSYPQRPDIKVLDGLNIVFPAGKMTAIVGPSGSGKSTIVSLIERWYELDETEEDSTADMFERARFFPCRGRITAGGQRLRDLDRRWWRTQVGLVQQEPFLFNDTIFSNVAHGLVGSPWETASDAIRTEMVHRACQEAYADEFISRLPDGYQTAVGDGGLKLSGGQRQRLAIARAIVKHPAVLILDEATSAIDVRSEQLVQAALDRASRDRTTITIAHRLSTVRKASNIVVLRRGRVVEQGTHAELMALGEGGAYYALATAQELLADEKREDEEESEFKDAKSIELAKSEVDEASASHGETVRAVLSKEPILSAESAVSSMDDESAQNGQQQQRRQQQQPLSEGLLSSFFVLLKEQRGQWPWYLLLFGGAVVAGASSPIQAYLFAMLISLFSLLGQPAWLHALSSFWCLMFTVLAISVGISYFALGWSATTTAFNITQHYRKEYLRNMLAQPVAFFDQDAHSIGSLTARLATDPTQLQQLLGMNLAFVVISLLNVLGCLIVSFCFGWKLTVVTVLTSMPVLLGAAFVRVRYERQAEQENNAVFAQSAQFATEAVGAVRTVSALTLEKTIADRYAALLQGHIRAALRQSSVSTLIFALSDSIALLCMAFVLWYGGKLMADHEYLSFQYVVVYIAVMQGGMGAGQWLSFGPNIAQASAAASRILGLRRSQGTDGRLVSLDVGDLGEKDRGAKIAFENVWFRYPTRDAPVLNGLTLQIEKGQFAAIVGASGSGKTTVISLLERFYDVGRGRILCNGLDIADLELATYRQDLSLVAQEPCLFDGSLRENVLLGVPEITADNATVGNGKDAEDMNARLNQAAADAGLRDFVQSLPQGWATPVGSHGVALSGGQKQRVSLARALVRRPRLLLLDEATSSLDAETEREVQIVLEAGRRLQGPRESDDQQHGRSLPTMIVVAHRLATVQRADIIFVLGDGRVLEKGNHASLIAQRGVYYQMCQAQALN